MQHILFLQHVRFANNFFIVLNKSVCVCVVNVLSTSKVIWRLGAQLKVSCDRLEKTVIEPGTSGLQGE